MDRDLLLQNEHEPNKTITIFFTRFLFILRFVFLYFFKTQDGNNESLAFPLLRFHITTTDAYLLWIRISGISIYPLERGSQTIILYLSKVIRV